MTMTELFQDFESRLITAGLVRPGQTLMGFLDADLSWNTGHEDQELGKRLFKRLNINSLMISRLAEPYQTIIDYLARTSGTVIEPQDCETRTFLHDLPVADRLDADVVVPLLKRRKSVIVPGRGIITYGTVSLEQAFVTFSSVCFTAFVKFFSDFLADVKQGRVPADFQAVFEQVREMLPPPPFFDGTLIKGPFENEEQVLLAMDEAGKLTVRHRLVDSFFGNISVHHNGVLYISQTGSSLDHLPGCIDPCAMDGSSCAALTASSELSAHMEIIRQTGHRAILHGHPRFSVILSMDCTVRECTRGDTCYLNCPHPRNVAGVPIVPGEVGTGRYGLCNTVPPAMVGHPGVIVYGHGLFCTAENDFNQAFKNLMTIENTCRDIYFERIKGI
jgi:ribulose-5-phosphate 4-epimerase/fuculose-1-phosphate aldolase